MKNEYTWTTNQEENNKNMAPAMLRDIPMSALVRLTSGGPGDTSKKGYAWVSGRLVEGGKSVCIGVEHLPDGSTEQKDGQKRTKECILIKVGENQLALHVDPVQQAKPSGWN